MNTIAAIIIAMPLLLACGALIVGYVLWRDRRRDEDAAADRIAQPSGGGGPRPVEPK